MRALGAQGGYLAASAFPPPMGRGGPPMQLLALAGAPGAVVLDVARTPELSALIAQQHILAAWDAKAMAHALWDACCALPRRWACAQLTSALAPHGRAPPHEPSGLWAQEGLDPPAPAGTSAAALAAEAAATGELVARLGARLAGDQMVAVSRLEAGAVNAVAAMERHGMPLDARRWRACVQAEQDAQRRLLDALEGPLGRTLAIAPSDAELLAACQASGVALPDLSRASLATLPPRLAPLRELLALRRRTAAMGEHFLRHLDADGRVRATFVQLGARTGRMACTRPNLQGVPSDEARRRCFAPAPGRVLVVGDYAACELRILAEMSGDDRLIAALGEAADVHSAVATELFGTQVSRTERPELRQAAKAIGFGLIYGMGAEALGHRLACNVAEADALMRRYFATYPRMAAYLHEDAEAALRRGHTRSMLGRRLELDGRQGAAARRLARNMPIQASGADMVKLALGALQPALAELAGTQLVHCVHDEVVLEAPAEGAEAAAAVLEAHLKAGGAQMLRRVPVAVTLGIHSFWRAH